VKWQDAKPKPKVAGGVLAGALSVILVWVLSLFGIEVPGAVGWVLSLFGIEVPGAVGAAIATVIAFVVAWLIPEASDG